MRNINRESPNIKINSLVKITPELIDEVEHLSFLEKLLPIKLFTSRSLYYLRDVSTLLAFGINFILIISERLEFNDKEKKSVIIFTFGNDFDVKKLFNNLGLCQLITSCMMVFMYCIIYAPLILKRKWRKLGLSNKNRFNLKIIEKKLKENDDNIKLLSLNEIRILLLVYGPYHYYFNKNNKRNFGHVYANFEYKWTNIKFLFQDGSFMFFIFYILISIIGYQVSEMVYCLHLLDIIVNCIFFYF